MDEKLKSDIIDWDVVNWSKALHFWSSNVNLTAGNLFCLELGGNKGGLSLWLALNGNKVVCSDLESPEKQASLLHEKYGCIERIEYQSINATNIPYENTFDIVVFKSILGGISGNGNNHLRTKTVEEIYKCLKPGGILLFAENLEASFLHKAIRKRFVKWGGRWNYLKYTDIDELFDSFETVKYETVGFFGTFGRTERQRRFLGNMDQVLRFMIPGSKRYIVYGIAVKGS